MAAAAGVHGPRPGDDRMLLHGRRSAARAARASGAAWATAKEPAGGVDRRGGLRLAGRKGARNGAACRRTHIAKATLDEAASAGEPMRCAGERNRAKCMT
ncbi:hypothetical protein DO72_5183 [Burkholderia pseudomallei]|nr:hypothetical protein DO72_5183 [Burkholderia pseudomallei]